MGQAFAVKDSDIVVNLEEPAASFPATGISNLRGWAVGPNGIDRVELLLDGSYLLDVPYGGRRTDVGNSYPQYPGAAASGYSMAFNYGNLEVGEHTFTVRARDRYGDYNETSATIHVERFAEGFYSESDAFDLNGADAAIDGNDVMIYHVGLGADNYNLAMRWHVPSQKLALYAIEPFDLAAMIGAEGIWEVDVTEDATDCGGTVTTESGVVKVTDSAEAVHLFDTDFTFAAVYTQPGAVELTGSQTYTDSGATTQVDWRLLFYPDATLTGVGEWVRGACSGETLIQGVKQ